MSAKRSAIVTGGSRGIGRATALALADDGFDIAFCYRGGVAAAAETEAALRERGVAVYQAPCDVADAEAVEAFVKAAEEELGEVDALVNSAGIVRDNPMVLMPHADWNAVIDTNLTGTFNFCRTVAFGFMKRRSGAIVNLSSVAGVYGTASQTNYSAAKAGINGMSRALAKELAPYGVRVNVVAPGFIETDMTAELPDKVRDKAKKTIPMRRFGEASDVADLVSFLVSEKAGYITGQVLQVDGGIVI
ncbi:3-oxoacyl-[acyl-carrier-protein] reductase [Saccharothrix sp. S26]|uniref:3-oxoacyl-[acyl-carrier-protein] reductase n=1 Tax=Saccharothrix sp. S26 TaxID=2907215 RepID=UPI001F434A63|nr:3-oxoacyl-[acyl-carrier-protein] reductase [Saccharothrix sp. S26]MCE6995137.1 3-oxoacyl-[acyl-carrier-protein] reductase [Saccharothrix sp. S26]